MLELIDGFMALRDGRLSEPSRNMEPESKVSANNPTNSPGPSFWEPVNAEPKSPWDPVSAGWEPVNAEPKSPKPRFCLSAYSKAL